MNNLALCPLDTKWNHKTYDISYTVDPGSVLFWKKLSDCMQLINIVLPEVEIPR